MPIYEYTCTKCGKDFEELVFGDDLPACPHCGAAETRIFRRLRRLLRR